MADGENILALLGVGDYHRLIQSFLEERPKEDGSPVAMADIAEAMRGIPPESDADLSAEGSFFPSGEWYPEAVDVVPDVGIALEEKRAASSFSSPGDLYERSLSPETLYGLPQCDLGRWDPGRIADAVVQAPTLPVKKALVAGMLACLEILDECERAEEARSSEKAAKGQAQEVSAPARSESEEKPRPRQRGVDIAIAKLQERARQEAARREQDAAEAAKTKAPACNHEHREWIERTIRYAVGACGHDATCFKEAFPDLRKLVESRTANPSGTPLLAGQWQHPNPLHGLDARASLFLGLAGYEAATVRPGTSRIRWHGVLPLFGMELGASLLRGSHFLSAAGIEASVAGGFAAFPGNAPLERWTSAEDAAPVPHFLFVRPQLAAVYARRIASGAAARVTAGYGIEFPFFLDAARSSVVIPNAPHSAFAGADLLLDGAFTIGLRGGYTFPADLGEDFFRKTWECRFSLGLRAGGG